MKRYLSTFSVLLLLGTAACKQLAPQTTVVPTDVAQAATVEIAATPTTPPEASATALTPTASMPITGAAATTTPPPPTATSGPLCTVLKNANFRTGPGTAYQPPLRALKTGTQVIPQGFSPNGVPAGSWVQALEPGENQVGWLNMDPQLINCNLDVTTLPQVAVEPPPPPPAPVVSNSQVDGEPNGLEGSVEFSPNFLMRMKVRDPNGSQDGDGIKRVTFTISDDSGTVYQRTENTAAYCIFGGGEPDCNPWTEANGKYLWQPDGQTVKEGTYNASIVVEPSSANGDESQFGNWFFTITLQFH